MLLLLTFLEPAGLLFAVIFGLVFFYVLLIKDLVLIDRKSAYEITIFFLAFLLFLDFYERQGGSINDASLFYSFIAALLVGFLIWNFIRCFSGGEQRPPLHKAAIWLSTLVIWQFLIVGLFLPVDFVYQTIITFIGSIFVIDLVPQYLFGESSRTKVLVTLSIVFVFLFSFSVPPAGGCRLHHEHYNEGVAGKFFEDKNRAAESSTERLKKGTGAWEVEWRPCFCRIAGLYCRHARIRQKSVATQEGL